MPHDKKGRLVEVGDFVKVKPYNTAQTIVGRVSFVNPGSETCNARVVFVDHHKPSSYLETDAAPFRTKVEVPVREDYTECRAMEIVLKADGSEPKDEAPLATDPVAQVESLAQGFAAAPAPGDAGDPTTSGFGRIGAVLAAGVLALVALAAPALAQDAGPVAATPPSAIAAANAAPLSISTELGGLVTLTPEGGTSVTPTGFINIEGPLVLGHSSIARAYARLGITSDPGADISLAEYKNWKAAEVGLGALRVVGASGEVTTSVVGEFSFSSRIKGSSDTAPLQRLVRSAAAGVRFDAKKTGASMSALVGYDEATTRCVSPLVCTGVHSGLAFIAYGQAPIAAGGALAIIADVSLSVGTPIAGVTRNDVFRLGLITDPAALVAAVKGK